MMQSNIQDLIQKGIFTNPHRILGLQTLNKNQQVIRLWRPDVAECRVEVCGEMFNAKKVHEAGLYEYEPTSWIQATDYRVFYPNGKLAFDPYSFAQAYGELDIHLISRGLHYELYDFLGATFKTHCGVKGVHFGLWAPNALSVSLIADFNHWDSRLHPMQSVGTTGIWEIFIPDLEEGEKYKFHLVTKEGNPTIRTDPAAHFFELRPKNAAIVCDIDRFVWEDKKWLEERKKYAFDGHPINIYEIHLGSWQREENGNFLNYRQLAERLAAYCQKMHYTHVELMGVCEHPLDESWGYQVTGYFAPTSRYGSPQDFQYLVDYLHKHQIGVIVDWVPAHFPTDTHWLAKFDGTCLYEHVDPQQGLHPHWYTHIFNHNRLEVSNFLIASAFFWVNKMHIDGLRVDAVASMLYLDYGRSTGQWVPNQYHSNLNLESIEFLKHLNSVLHAAYPEVLMIAEESSAFDGVTRSVQDHGLGFDLKWNMGWMNDTLRFFSTPFYERGNILSCLTFLRVYAFSEKFALVLSHDEVVHGKKSLLSKMCGNDFERMSNLRLLISFMICFPGKKLLFMGGELGQYEEWNCYGQIAWHLLSNPMHAKLQNFVAAINLFYLENKALFERDYQQEAFQWVDFSDRENAVVSYVRRGVSQTLLCVHHFNPGVVKNYKIYLSHVAQIQEVFNTDSGEWGGSGTINSQIIVMENAIEITLSSIATLIFDVKFR